MIAKSELTIMIFAFVDRLEVSSDQVQSLPGCCDGFSVDSQACNALPHLAASALPLRSPCGTSASSARPLQPWHTSQRNPFNPPTFPACYSSSITSSSQGSWLLSVPVTLKIWEVQVLTLEGDKRKTVVIVPLSVSEIKASLCQSCLVSGSDMSHAWLTPDSLGRWLTILEAAGTLQPCDVYYLVTCASKHLGLGRWGGKEPIHWQHSIILVKALVV